MKTYKSQELVLKSNGFTTNNKVTFVNGTPTHTFNKGAEVKFLIHLGIGKGFKIIAA